MHTRLVGKSGDKKKAPKGAFLLIVNFARNLLGWKKWKIYSTMIFSMVDVLFWIRFKK